MLKSPIKLSSRPSAIDVNVLDGSTVVAGVPGVDSVYRRQDFTGGFIYPDPSNQILFYDLGIVDSELEGKPISFTTSDADLPDGIVERKTYWLKLSGIGGAAQIYATAPGSAALVFNDDGTGTHTILVHDWAKYVWISNFGATACVVAPCYDDSFTISDPDEWPIIHPDAAKPFLMDVFGYKALAFEGLGGTTDVRISPLENY